jgi:hypothetical protein
MEIGPSRKSAAASLPDDQRLTSAGAADARQRPRIIASAADAKPLDQ